jgi:hypothetical protein
MFSQRYDVWISAGFLHQNRSLESTISKRFSLNFELYPTGANPRQRHAAALSPYLVLYTRGLVSFLPHLVSKNFDTSMFSDVTKRNRRDFQNDANDFSWLQVIIT